MADDSSPAEIPTKAEAAPAEIPTKASPLRSRKRQLIGGALAIAVIGGTFVFVLPRIADYRDVWEVVKTLSWPQVVALLVVVLVNGRPLALPWIWSRADGREQRESRVTHLFRCVTLAICEKPRFRGLSQ